MNRKAILAAMTIGTVALDFSSCSGVGTMDSEGLVSAVSVVSATLSDRIVEVLPDTVVAVCVGSVRDAVVVSEIVDATVDSDGRVSAVVVSAVDIASCVDVAT